MSRSDLEIALSWAREEGWNPGLDDGNAFYAQDPSGFLMGWLDGEPVGCISVVKYDDGFAFLGLYIVRPPWRGRGYGKAIWDAGIASAGNRTIGLDGVVAQQDNYRRSGFVLAHRSARWSGMGKSPKAGDRSVRAVARGDLDAINRLDQRYFPASRDDFLSAWLAPGPTRVSLCFDVAGRIAGFGCVRRSIDGYRIGPLFAEQGEVGEALLHALVARTGAERVQIDIPAPNRAATLMATGLGLTPSFETARMYRGPIPAIATMSIFGITTLELG